MPFVKTGQGKIGKSVDGKDIKKDSEKDSKSSKTSSKSAPKPSAVKELLNKTPEVVKDCSDGEPA